MPKPGNVETVRRSYAFVNYLYKFLPHLTEVLEAIQQLRHKGVAWRWKHEHDAAFRKAKSLLHRHPC